jgi:hypothetical protein
VRIKRSALCLACLADALPRRAVGSAASPQTTARVAATFGNVYTGAALQVPWYVTGGYMDWRGNATAERAPTTSAESRWQYPSLWHSFNVLVPPNYATLEVIMLDTVTLAGAMLNNPGNHEIPAGIAPVAAPAATDAAAAGVAGAPPVAGVAGAMAAPVAMPASASAKPAAAAAAAPEPAPAPGPAPATRRALRDFNLAYNPPISQLQWAWVSQMLNASTADWLIVVGNDPIWSAGQHGPTWALADRLLPMLNAAGVSLYISGRDPVPQHFAPSATYPAMDSVVIGNGAGGNASQAAALPSAALCPKGTLNWAGSGAAGGFLTVSMKTSPTVATEGLMSVTFYDETGAELHSFTKPNPRKGGRSDPPATGRAAVSASTQKAGAIGFFALVVLALGAAGLHTWNEAHAEGKAAARAGASAQVREPARVRGHVAGERTPLMPQPQQGL